MDIHPLNAINEYHMLHGLPAFVKEAAVVTTDDVKDLPQTAFADPMRKLPVHSKIATWCSYLSYHSGAVEDPTLSAAVKLEKAAEFWGIGAECRTVAQNLQKQAAPRLATDDDFALVTQHNGDKVRRLPIAGPGNVEKSAEDLVTKRALYPLPWRKAAAQRIIKKASELSVQLVGAHQLQQMAGVGMAKAAEIIPHLKLRSRMVKDAEIRGRLDALVEEVQKLDSVEPGTLTKMAEAIDLSDRASGLYQYYGRGLETPEEICHRHTLKEAREKRAGLIGLTNGQGVSKEALAKLSADTFTALGDDFVAAIRGSDGKVDTVKAAEIVPTLPAGDANLFVNSL